MIIASTISLSDWIGIAGLAIAVVSPVCVMLHRLSSDVRSFGEAVCRLSEDHAALRGRVDEIAPKVTRLETLAEQRGAGGASRS